MTTEREAFLAWVNKTVPMTPQEHNFALAAWQAATNATLASAPATAPDRHAQELLAQDITLQNMRERHAQELCAYELTVQNLRAELAQSQGEPVCSRCESLSRAVMMDQVAHDMNLVAEKYAHKLALDLECVLSDYSGKWWNAAIETLGKYREEMSAIHERESPTFMGEPRL